MAPDPPEPLPFAGLQCPDCGYDLSGLPEPRCPECGIPLEPSALSNRKRSRLGPLLFLSAFCGSLVVLSSMSTVRVYARYTGWCGTPQANAYMVHVILLPPLMIPALITVWRTRRNPRSAMAGRLTLLIPLTVWSTVWILITYRG